jgi:hypothetical protein
MTQDLQSGVMARQGMVAASFSPNMQTVIPTSYAHLDVAVATIALRDGCRGKACVASLYATVGLVDLWQVTTSIVCHIARDALILVRNRDIYN